MIACVLFLIDYSLSLLRKSSLVKLFVNSCASKSTSPFKFDVPTIEADAVILPDSGFTFRPLLYVQRYTVITKIIEEKIRFGGSKKVVDFGCAEISLFKYVKNIEGVEEYIAVDIDEALLQRYLLRVEPLTYELIVRRTTPFNAKVLCGSVSEPDARLLGAEVVIAIELIEHLYPETLEDLPFNIFGVIQPDVAVFTTPNVEFNVLFCRLEGFRHDDHKFEWTREQFSDWANNLVLRYPNYEVDIGGIGPGPVGTEHLGCSSQIAVFFRTGDRFVPEDVQCEETYKTLADVDYPFISKQEHLENTVRSRANTFVHFSVTDCTYLVDKEHYIPLEKVTSFINLCISCTEEEVRTILKVEWTIVETDSGSYSLVVPEYGLDDGSSVDSEPIKSDDAWDQYVVNKLDIATEYSDWDEMSDKDTPEALPTIVRESNEIDSKRSPEMSGAPQPQTETLEEAKVSVNFKEIHLEDSNGASLPKCHSLEQINPSRNKNKSFRFSLNMEKSDVFNCDVCCPNSESKDRDKSLPSFSDSFGLRLEDSSQSKAVDSGYPNSFGQDMEMDLTPEQVDEIITETESSFDEDEESISGDEVVEENRPLRLEPLQPPVLHFLDNVENGDVANNNRDGEGNNMEENIGGDGGADFLQGVVQEVDVEIPNMAEARHMHYPEVESDDEAISNTVEGSSQADSILPTLDEDVIHRCFANQGIASGSMDSPLPTSPSLPTTPFNTRNPSVDQIAGTCSLERFPTWLCGILIDDVEESSLCCGDVEPILVTGSADDVRNQEVDGGFDSGSSYEVIVPGDVLGGGDPFTTSP